MDDKPMEDTARHLLFQGEIVQWKPPSPQKAGYAPLQSSAYVLEEGSLDTPGMIMTLDLRVWMDQLKEWDITGPISSWLVNYVHHIMTNGLASMDDYEITARFSERDPAHRGALTERLIIAMNLLDPGFIVMEDRKELVEKLKEGKQSRTVMHPKTSLSKTKLEQLYTCRPKGQEQTSPPYKAVK